VGALVGGLSVDRFGVVSAMWLGSGLALLTAIVVFPFAADRNKKTDELTKS